MSKPRTSTLVLLGLFIGVLALYVLVRPANDSTTETPVKHPQTPTGPCMRSIATGSY